MGRAAPAASSVHPAETVAASVRRAAVDAGRAPESVRLVAVSKTRTLEEVRAAARAGITDFGENFLQDALPKIQAGGELGITWHFIGAVQSNKTRDIARHFQWVHTLDRPRIAERLHRQRADPTPLDVCIQVNVDAEERKAGVAPDGIGALVVAVQALDRLRLRGLMAIPALRDAPQETRTSFARMRELFEAHRTIGGDHWDTLSMGMTADYAVAIQEGSTCVRIGTAIFGPRSPRPGSATGHPSHAEGGG